MTPEQARQLLLRVINTGRISMNGQPLNGVELSQLQNAVLLLYDGAKEKEETEEEDKSKPKNEGEEK